MSRVHNLASSSFKSLYSEKLTKPTDTKGASSSQSQNVLHIECEARKVKAQIEKELHEKRIRELKSLIPAISEEDWKFLTVDELLGLTSN